MSTTNIAGVKFSDTLAALLDHASANGWRVEKDTRGRTAKGVLVYPPDTTIPPITVEERGAKFNPGHYSNLRSQMYRAGLPPLPGDGPALLDAIGVATPPPDERIVVAASETEALRGLPKGTVPMEIMPGVGFARTPELERILTDADVAPRFVGNMTEGLARQAGVGQMEADLIGALVQMATDWALMNGSDRLAETAQRVRDELAVEYEGQIRDALAMVEEAEANAARAEKRAEKAEAREAQARKDCGEALDRARAAEARAHELDAAIAPMRALFAPQAG